MKQYLKFSGLDNFKVPGILYSNCFMNVCCWRKRLGGCSKGKFYFIIDDYYFNLEKCLCNKINSELEGVDSNKLITIFTIDAFHII